jgi:hypothetical protein
VFRFASPPQFDAQPQDAVAVDWHNPITAGLVFAQVGDSPENVAGASTLLGTLDGQTNTGGRGLDFTGNAANRVELETTGVSASGTALAFFYLPSAAGATERIPIGAFRVGAGLDVGNYLAIDASRAFATTTDGDNWLTADWSYGGVRDRDFLLVGRFTAGGGRDLWGSGILRNTEGTPRNPSSINRIVLGAYQTVSPGNAFFGTMYLSCWWDRVLSDDEVRSVSAQPWQLFRGPSMYIGLPLATLVPISTNSNAGWTASAGTAHAALAAVGGANVSASSNGAALVVRLG